jgi:periplasmic protein TonB
MQLDPSTLCARTTAGEAELATPSQGLALGQRRVLTLLQDPVAVDELAERHRLDPDKLARDLTRLADLKLIVLQRPSIAPAPMNTTATMAPIVIGRSARRPSAMPLAAGIAAVALAVGTWYGTRDGPAPAQTPKSTAAPRALATVAPVPVSPVGDAADPLTQDASPATTSVSPARVLRDSARPTAARPINRPEPVAAVPVAAPVATAPISPISPTPNPAPRPDNTSRPPTIVPTANAPVIAASPAPAPAPPPAPTAAADPPPAVQVAAAAPSSVVPRPTASTGLKAISREPPDFPREAVADGLRSGLVNARIHVDARGNVTGVDILRSQPPKVFDRAARRALMLWQFEPNSAGQPSDLDVDVKFQRD